MNTKYTSAWRLARLADIIRYVGGPIVPGESLLNSYFKAMWTNIFQAIGPESKPYLPVVTSLLVNAASTITDISVHIMC